MIHGNRPVCRYLDVVVHNKLNTCRSRVTAVSHNNNRPNIYNNNIIIINIIIIIIINIIIYVQTCANCSSRKPVRNSAKQVGMAVSLVRPMNRYHSIKWH